MSLHRRLLLLVVGVALPLLVSALGGLYLLAKEKRNALERSLVERARAMSAAVDNELGTVVAAAQALSSSPLIDEHRFDALYRFAHRIKDQHPAWQSVAFSTPEGATLFGLGTSSGASLPGVEDDLGFKEVRAKQRPVIGSLFKGPQGEALFPVHIPVLREGELRYVISLGVKPDVLLGVIERQRIPQEGVFAVIDRSDTIVARSRNVGHYLGKQVTPDLRHALHNAAEGFAKLFTLEGEATYAAFIRSSHTGWAVSLGVPQRTVDDAVRKAIALLAGGLVVSLLAGALIALFLARGIIRPVRALARAADAVARGDPPVFPRGGVREVQQVAGALADALEVRRRAENEKEAALRSEREARSAAEAASRQKDQFLAMLGHELRNPLASISNGVELLMRRPPAELVNDVHAMLSRQVGHLAHVTNDLLQVGRVMTGRIELARSPLDLAALVHSAVDALRRAGRLAEREVAVQTEAVWVEGDVHRLEQVLSNLVTNAVKYTRPNGTIRVWLARENGEAVLRVQDNGIGMEPEVLRHAFDLFYQADRTMARADGGLGIGLTLARRLVELHGGTVSAESPGAQKGSTFTVRLPALARPPEGEAGAKPAPALGRYKVVVVEDNDDARESLVQLLRLEGHEVREARDGPEGVKAVLAGRPDVALIDLGLPGFDGYECARRIRGAPGGKAIFLVALSGYGLEDHKRQAAEAGFDLHVTKPASARAILEIFAARRKRG